MSEAKRPKLISLESQKNGGENAKKAVRIAITIQEPTEDRCVEFNYKDELLAAKKKPTVVENNVKAEKINGLDPFNDDNDDDVKRIAAEMEAKYGGGIPKKRKWRKDDYADIGMGYDESDSFIDNTDGYDEVVPRNVTTIHGGFYINCGALEFKSVDEATSNESSSSENEEEDKSEEEKNNKVNKRKIESSSNSEDETHSKATAENLEKKKHLVKKQKLLSNTIGLQKAIKKRLFSQEKIKIKKRNEEQKKSVRDMLKERRFDRLTISSSENEEKKEEDSNSSSPPVKEKKKVVIPTASISVDKVIEAIVNDSVKKDELTSELAKKSSIEITPVPPAPVVTDSINKELHAVQISENKNSSAEVVICQLPPNLPVDIVAIIEDIKKAAASNTEGKVKFFNDHVNSMLFNLEVKCRCLGKHSRGRVYEHLAPFVKCKKETLIKRAKNLCIIEDQKKLKSLIVNLKIKVGAVMPDLIKNYEQESSIILQKRFSQQPEDSNKSLRMPKRSFPWSDETKKLIKDIVALQKKCYIMEGKLKDSLEQLLLDFIKSDILPIWPDGWMSVNNLAKYCSSVVDFKKKAELAKPKLTVAVAQNVSNPIVAPPIISSNSSLTITPVVPTQKLGSEITITPKNLILNDEMIITKTTSSPPKVNHPSSSSSKVEIIKTPPKPVPPSKPAVSKVPTSSPELIVIDDPSSPKPSSTIIRKQSIEISENLSSKGLNLSTNNFPKKEYNNSNHFQIIDLTDANHKKVIHQKSKPPPLPPPVQHHKVTIPPAVKVKDEITTGSSALTQLITDSLNDTKYVSVTNNLNHFSTTTLTSAPKNETPKTFSADCVVSKSTVVQQQPTCESDEIQQVMENIKALQRLSSPTIKSNSNDLSHKNGSGVSVISFNSSSNFGGNYSNTSPQQQPTSNARSSSFQDAFQKKFIPDFMKASQTVTHSLSGSSNNKGSSNPSTTPPGYNNSTFHKQNSLTSVKSNFGNMMSERYFQNSINNNYAQQNCNTLKINCSSQQSGTHSLHDELYIPNKFGHLRPGDGAKTTGSHNK